MRGDDLVAGVVGSEVTEHRRFEIHRRRGHEWQDTTLLATSLLGGIVVERDARIVEESREAGPALKRTIGRTIDVNYHLLTGSGQAPPADYFGSFVQLALIGVVDAGFARELAACAGLRNRIVHEYDELDHARVFEAVGRALSDIPAYLGAVQRHLSKFERP